MYKDCRGPTLLICSISCHIMPHHAIRLLKNCKPALIPSSIAEVRLHILWEMQGGCVMCKSVGILAQLTETENGWTWNLYIYIYYAHFRGDEGHPKVIIWEYPWTPKPWKMKVLHPKIWVITPKSEGCGFPWYIFFYESFQIEDTC